ncbi:MAG: hypothetical protein Q8M94_12545 [Ignavibacteria bacterium]|nr:hypothetical protein [Ignavibacteria bacterium]
MKKNHYKFSSVSSFIVVLITLLLYNPEIQAQETPSTETEFPVGAFLSIIPTNSYNRVLYEKFTASGMNTIVPRADNGTKDYLTNLTVIPWNQSYDNWSDWIQYYITGFYSKWEAEENQTNENTVGVKHRYGQDTTWRNTVCWSSIGLTGPKDSLMYGPHYHQEKVYRRFLVDSSRALSYTPRIKMALHNPEEVPGSEDVCRIKVFYRYKVYHDPQWNYTIYDTILLSRILKVSDFYTDGSFKDYFFGIPPLNTYRYDAIFPANELKYNNQMQNSDFPKYSDLESNLGIQFCVDWLRNDSFCTLNIDYAEVYDNLGWNEYVNPLTHNTVISRIQNYTQSFSGWNNIKYWYGHDEPYTIDAIEPMRIVDSLVRDAGGAPIVTAQLIGSPEYWSPINGIILHQKIYEEVKPIEVMIDYYPFYTEWDVPNGLEVLRTILTETHRMKPGYWYIGQAFGKSTATGTPCLWRMPDTSEVKASVMLALAHGVKGILFWNFESGVPQNPGDCYTNGILDLALNETDLYYVIKNNFSPRLKGTLGKTLLGLDYTGNYLPLKHITPTQNPAPQPSSYDYLTIGLQPATNDDMNWHVGFFDRTNHNDDKYFLMANLWTNSAKSIQVRVTPPVQGYTNYRFRNVEPENNFDVTFNTETTQTLSFPAGEGYLFQVAPVVLYGGKLVYNENVGDGMTLTGDMTIENGATLTVNGTYNAKANITVKAGGKIVSAGNGKIIFDPGKKLFVEGSSDINGTSTNRLALEFSTDSPH